MNITNLSVTSLKRVLAIKEQIESLQAELSKIAGGATVSAPKAASKAAAAPKAAAASATAAPAKRTRRKMSPEARAKIAAAQKARWAKAKAAPAASKPKKS